MTQRFVKMLKEKFQRVLNCFDKRSAVIMTIVAIIMCVSLFQNHAVLEMTRESLNQTEESLTIVRESLELQKKEFELRNRPYLAISNYNLSKREIVDLQGKKWPCCVEFKLTNISEIPANNVRLFAEVYLNDISIRKIDYLPVALPKGNTKPVTVGLPDHIYSNAKNEENKFVIKNDLKYFGMLGKGNIKYRTYETVCYFPTEEIFKVIEQEYQ